MKTKILIAGIGGVGGYFGGSLAKHFENYPDVEISFIARGSHLQEIQKNGLKVVKGDQEFITRPFIATDNPSQIGIADYIIVCTKSYDLESVIQQLKPCITKGTIILPLLNGVDSRQRIQALLPGNIVLDGCAYIVARLKQNGVVENIGNIQTLYFGLDNYENTNLDNLELIFKQAGIEATYSKEILKVIWEKFIFISPTATATSYFDKSPSEILSNDENVQTVSRLIEEIKQLAVALDIPMPENISEITMNKFKSIPAGATSSMHNDFRNKKAHTELESLTGYVISECEKIGLEAPVYKTMYRMLQNKQPE